MSLASNLNLDMRWLHPTAWVYWQVLDDTGGWGLVSVVILRAEVLTQVISVMQSLNAICKLDFFNSLGTCQ